MRFSAGPNYPKTCYLPVLSKSLGLFSLMLHSAFISFPWMKRNETKKNQAKTKLATRRPARPPSVVVGLPKAMRCFAGPSRLDQLG